MGTPTTPNPRLCKRVCLFSRKNRSFVTGEPIYISSPQRLRAVTNVPGPHAPSPFLAVSVIILYCKEIRSVSLRGGDSNRISRNAYRVDRPDWKINPFRPLSQTISSSFAAYRFTALARNSPKLVGFMGCEEWGSSCGSVWCENKTGTCVV